MAEPVKFERRSAHKLQPQQRAEVEKQLSTDERTLLKAEKSASYHRGGLHGFAVGMVIGAIFVLATTTAMFDPIGKVFTTRFIAEQAMEESR